MDTNANPPAPYDTSADEAQLQVLQAELAQNEASLENNFADYMVPMIEQV